MGGRLSKSKAPTRNKKLVVVTTQTLSCGVFLFYTIVLDIPHNTLTFHGNNMNSPEKILRRVFPTASFFVRRSFFGSETFPEGTFTTMTLSRMFIPFSWKRARSRRRRALVHARHWVFIACCQQEDRLRPGQASTPGPMPSCLCPAPRSRN